MEGENEVEVVGLKRDESEEVLGGGQEPMVSVDSLSYEELLKEKDRLKSLLYSRENELRQLEQMEKRLLDSQKQDEPLNENEPKDLCDILGEFPPNTLKSLQELLLLNEKEIPSRPYSIFQEEIPETKTKKDIGLDCIYQQMNEFSLNLIICGPKGVGKTTLFNSLFLLSEALETTLKGQISYSETILKEGSTRLRVSCMQADPKNTNLLLSHIAEMNQNHFTNDLKNILSVSVNETMDRRIHCCLYLLPSYACHGTKSLKEFDIQNMKALSEKVNVIPIISKCDTLTTNERSYYKSKLLEAINDQDIKVFLKEHYQKEGKFPLCVSASTKEIKTEKGSSFGREYLWAPFDSENPSLSDISELRDILIKKNYYNLIFKTEEKYGQFKLTKKKELEINKANGGDVGKKRGKKRNTLLKDLDKRQSQIIFT